VSPRTWQQRIEDILSCAKNIKDYTEGMSYEAFLDDPKTIRALAFEFTTIGEATRAIPMEIQRKYNDVPWGKMQGFRNVLVREYFRLDEQVLWEASQEDIPPLVTALENILQANP
jgi:uncharacterized protein with HEPN domain